MSEEDLQAEVSAEMKTVQDMWQHRLDALHDVQPTLAEALADRGLPEMAVLVRAEADDSDATGEGAGAAGAGEEDGSDVDSMDDKDE
ncbi:unnamed protein product, partial [Ectocarpus sp. 8 AP-2014]